MTINTDVQSTSGHGPEEIKEKVEGAAGEIKETVQGRAGEIKERVQGVAKEVAGRAREMKRFTPSRHTVRTSLLMSGACIGTIAMASAMRRRNPLEAFSLMGEELPFVGRRRARAFRPGHVLAGIGAIVGGSMILALVNQRIGRRVGHRPIVRGAMALLSAIGMDALLMGPSYIGKLVKTIGPTGTALKYGSIGSAYALSSRDAQEGAGGGFESIGTAGETAGPGPMYSGAEVGTVSGSPEYPQPLV